MTFHAGLCWIRIKVLGFLSCSLWENDNNFKYFFMQAAAPVFVDKDDQSNRWLNDITAKNLLVPKSLADVEGNYSACACSRKK